MRPREIVLQPRRSVDRVLHGVLHADGHVTGVARGSAERRRGGLHGGPDHDLQARGETDRSSRQPHRALPSPEPLVEHRGHRHHGHAEAAGDQERPGAEGLQLLVFPAQLPFREEVDKTELPDGAPRSLLHLAQGIRSFGDRDGAQEPHERAQPGDQGGFLQHREVRPPRPDGMGDDARVEEHGVVAHDDRRRQSADVGSARDADAVDCPVDDPHRGKHDVEQGHEGDESGRETDDRCAFRVRHGCAPSAGCALSTAPPVPRGSARSSTTPCREGG